jgi:hypothetical protein
MENELKRMEGINDTENGEETKQGENLLCGQTVEIGAEVQTQNE